MSPDAKENVKIHEYYLRRFLGTFDTQDIELNWNLGGISQDMLEDFQLTTASQTFVFVSFWEEKKRKWNNFSSTVASLNGMVGYRVDTSSKGVAASTSAAAAMLTLPPPHPPKKNRLYNLLVCLKDKKKKSLACTCAL